MITLSWPLVMTCFYFNLPIERVINGGRKGELVIVKQIAQYLMFQNGMKYESIAEITCSHWETVRYNIRQIGNKITPCRTGVIPDPKLRSDINILKSCI
jgi:hypothetical protein